MADKIQRFFQKHSISPEDIKYILREDGATNLYLIDGRVVSTYHPVKDFRDVLPIEQFLYPNKGIIAAASQIVNVENGYYKMADGRAFKYRVHNSLLHDNRLLMLGRNMERVQQVADNLSPAVLRDRFSMLDGLPASVCVIEYVSEGYGLNATLWMRYLNERMCEMEGLVHDEAIDRQFTDIYPEIDTRWIVTLADVALNGTARTIQGYDPKRDKRVQVFMYQPMAGFCCCVMVTELAESEKLPLSKLIVL